MEEKILPTWGYKPDGSAQIFDLEEGEDLPNGWYDRPPFPLGQEPEAGEPAPAAEPVPQTRPRRGRPPKIQENDEEPGAELASELRDE